MLGGLQTAFVREIKLWQRFDVLSSIETWEGSVRCRSAPIRAG